MINVWGIRDGNGVGWGEVKDGVFVPVLYGFVLSYSHPVLHDGKNFLTSFPSIGTPRSLAPLHKTLLFVNLPYN